MDESYGGVGDYLLLQRLMQELDAEIDAFCKAGYQLAENEAEYRMNLQVKILHERAKGTPVTVISDICRGDEEIAYLKQLRDSAEVAYKTCQEKINALKLDIRVINDQIGREWGRPNNT